jgi:hypothetical protein
MMTPTSAKANSSFTGDHQKPRVVESPRDVMVIQSVNMAGRTKPPIANARSKKRIPKRRVGRYRKQRKANAEKVRVVAMKMKR